MIRAQDVSKFYGSKRALGPVSFEIEDGETVGFLGLNGAGKTTALRIFACDLRPSAGRVVVGDIDAVKNPHEVRKRIGYLPENPPLYQEMVVSEYLTYAGKLRQMSKGEVEKRLPEVLELTNLTEVGDEVISTLSQGYRQRVGVAQAIVHNPKLLILDEPTRGLDPEQIQEMREMIQNLKDNHTVLVSSHILTEVSETCDRLLVLGKGEILASGSQSELAEKLTGVRQLVVVVRAGSEAKTAPQELLEAIEGVSEVSCVGSEDDASIFELTTTDDCRAEVCRGLVEGKHDVLQLTKSQRELEKIFLKLVTRGGSDASN